LPKSEPYSKSFSAKQKAFKKISGPPSPLDTPFPAGDGGAKQNLYWLPKRRRCFCGTPQEGGAAKRPHK